MFDETPTRTAPDYDVVIVGAGFAGLYALYRMRAQGLAAIVLEAGGDIGGTWYWNRYPGARCDIESLQYSYSFSDDLQQDWDWSERFATQGEILRYIHHVADRFDLRSGIQLNTRVVAATFEEPDLWNIETEAGNRIACRFCIMATGCLSVPKAPEIPGADDFSGETVHTGHWPNHVIRFAGRRVGVIGTGSSAIQSVPEIAKTAGHLLVFQRTPHFSVPARNRPVLDDERQYWKTNYDDLRRQAREGGASGVLYDFPTASALEASDEERTQEYARRWAKGGANFMHAYKDLLLDREANETAAEFVRSRIREIVQDPLVAKALSPRDYPIGTKRICVDDGYYETFNRPNVQLVDLRLEPLLAIAPEGVRTEGQTYALDVLVFATGFDAITGALARIAIRGREGRLLVESWAAGPRTYLGLMSAGFPNLFLVTGPGSPSVLSNVLSSAEHHVDWIATLLSYMARSKRTTVEPEQRAEDEWVAHVNEIANLTLFPTASSWYLGANVPGKPRVFMPYVGVPRYRRVCAEVAENGYRGFAFDGTGVAESVAGATATAA